MHRKPASEGSPPPGNQPSGSPTQGGPTEGKVKFESYRPFFTERSEPLHAMLINCGHEMAVNSDYRWDGLRRGDRGLWVWQYTIGGLGRVRLEGVDYPVPPGSAFLVKVPEAHIYDLPPGSPFWEFLYITVNGAELMRLGEEFRRRNGVVRSYAPASPTVKLVWELLAVCREKRLQSRYDASARAYRFMMTLLQEAPVSTGEETAAFLSRVHNFCRKNLHQTIGVADLAEAAGCSRWHFTRKFQELEGRTPHEFIIEQKMRLAVRILQTTTRSIKETAADCGFEDVSYFCKVFRRFHGRTPAAFREATRDGGDSLRP